MTNDITDPFDETGPCRECGEVDELRSGLCEACIEDVELEALEDDFEDDYADWLDYGGDPAGVSNY